jgi:hypothetical protein|tara:strand:- start:2460 stop:2645 length:186 start_codon:yes stop_codon:yes gene_type:complete
MKPNPVFELNVLDLELIEDALLYKQANSLEDSDRLNIARLLGKLHNQKAWYRPKDEAYVSG